MKTDPFEGLIFKPDSNAAVKSILDDLSGTVDETFNYGTQVLNWCAEKATDKPEDLPLIMMLRHTLELVGAISILVRESCIVPADILLRSLFETLLQAEFLLEKDTAHRGLCFAVWQIHDELAWLEISDETTPTGKEFRRKIKRDRLAAKMAVPSLSDAADRIASLKATLDSTKYQQVETGYKATRKDKKRKPTWYSLSGGPPNIEQLAQRLGYEGCYSLLYRSWSGTTHGTDILKGKVIPTQEGGAGIVPLRIPEGVEQTVTFAIVFALHLYRLYIRHYVPSREDGFREWCKSTVRQSYLRAATTKQINITLR